MNMFPMKNGRPPLGARMRVSRPTFYHSAFIRLDNDERFIFSLDPMSVATKNLPDLKITRYFAEVINAPVVNKAWSWGSESETSRVLFFRVWEDQIENDQVQVSWPSGKDLNGGRERTRHLDLMRSGRPTFGVICTAVQISSPTEPRTNSAHTRPVPCDGFHALPDSR